MLKPTETGLSIKDAARSLVGQPVPTVDGFIDEPSEAVQGNTIWLRGWAASSRPIQSIQIELGGVRIEAADRHARPDVVAAHKLPHVTGWSHALPARPDTANVRLLVDDREAATAEVACSPGTGDEAAPDISSNEPWDRFFALARELPAGSRVLEVGTRQSQPGYSTHMFPLFPRVRREDYVMCDVRPGTDVDVTADLHALPPAWSGGFDVVLADAVFEHLERPWMAASEVARVLKPGGVCLISTHQTYPLHGHPSDFFRFSKEALALIFRDAGLSSICCAYQHRAQILPPPDLVHETMRYRWNSTWPSYIKVTLLSGKL